MTKIQKEITKNCNNIVLVQKQNQVLNDSNEENNLKMDNSKNDEIKSKIQLVRYQVLYLKYSPPYL